MYPIYRFTLSGGGSSVTARPLYDRLVKEIARESGEQFYREKITGEMTFVRADYTFIMSKAFDTKFTFLIEISQDAGATWATYWTGYFFRTDCTINEVDKTIAVTPIVSDVYDSLLAGLDKEFNLIELAPEIAPVNADKRPMIQVYVPGDDVIACFLSGMWWEQECTPEVDESKLTQYGDNKLNFSLVKSFFMAEVSGTFSPAVPDIFTNVFVGQKFDPMQPGTQSFSSGNFTFSYYFNVGGGGYTARWEILRSGTALWRYTMTGGTVPDLSLPRTVTLTPVSGSGASGNVDLYIHEVPVYSRMICDTASVMGVSTSALDADDFAASNNYTRVIGYNFRDTIYFSTQLSNTPTQWGLYQPGVYYEQPYILGISEFFPISRKSWARESIWFAFSALDSLVESSGRHQFVLRDCYPLYSVISVLLGQIAPGVSHAGTSVYSEFLYATNPLTGLNQRLLVTPKSNVIFSNYDQPAQKAPITLRQVLDMLRDCYRCYWWVDSFSRFRIEHIEYFRRGGSYLSTPVIGVDLTSIINPRNGKRLAFGQDEYKFEKAEIAERYEFGWMDDVTQLFEGLPINFISAYAEAGRVEKITISHFTSDLDYILLNPNEISKDGFVLLSAEKGISDYTVSYDAAYYHGMTVELQNGYAAFNFLQLFYDYDMPAQLYEIIPGSTVSAQGTKRLKTQEKVIIPAINDPNPVQLVRTNVGDGTIRKISVYLQSRSAETTLEYDTE